MPVSRSDRRTSLAATTAVLFGFLALWLFTFDVQVNVGRDDGGADRPFCGSAYDVALLKHDGYMGGEPPGNQAEIDRACVTRSNRLVFGAGVAGVVATVAGLVAIGGFSRRFEHRRTALLLAVVAASMVPVGLGLVWQQVSRPQESIDELIVDNETAGAITKPTPEAEANLVLWVSNQSFTPESVHIDVQLDGEIVVDQEFAVGSQHNWVKFPLWLSPGKHELIVVSYTGVKMVKYFTMPDAKRHAVLDYWGKSDEGGKHFEWRIQKEPFTFA